MAAFAYKRTSTKEDVAYKGGNVPDGIYELMVDKAAYNDNKSTKGGIIAAVTLKIIFPEKYKNRLIFLNMSVVHPTKPDTEEKGRKAFDRLLDAIGIPAEDDFEIRDLETSVIKARVGEETQNPKEVADPNFQGRNRIVRYYDKDDPAAPDFGIDPPKEAPAARNTSRPADSRDRSRSRDERPAREERQERPSREGGREDSRERGREREDNRGREDSRERGRDDNRDARHDDNRGRGDESRSNMSREMDDDIPFDGSRDERRDGNREERGSDDNYTPRDRSGGGSPFGGARR